MERAGTRHPAAAPLLLVLLGLALHASALRGWWLTDDPQVLVQAIRESPASVLFDAHAYRYLSSSSFTPLVTVSFDADYTLFGVRPSIFYAHQLLAAIAAAILLFVLLRRYIPPLAAFLASAAALASPSMTIAVRSLMLRHYVEGLVLSLAALLLWSRRRQTWLSDAGAALAYLSAMLAKEFYAPLPVLLIVQALMTGGRWGRTATRALWLCAAATLYLFWRWSILGGGGGYGGSALADLSALPFNITKALFGAQGAGSAAFLLIGLVAVLLLALLAAWDSPRSTVLFAAAAIVFLAIPLLFVAPEFDPRYAFPSAVMTAAGAGLAARRRRAGIALLVVLTSMLLLSGILEGRRFDAETRQMVAEGEYVWSKPPTAPTLLAWSPGWYLEGLRDIREIETRSSSPRYILSVTPIALGEIPATAVWTSHRGQRVITPLDEDLLQQIAEQRRSYSDAEPLSLRFSRTANDLHWAVGPEPGRFTFLSWPGYDDFPMPSSGWRRLPESNSRQQFRIRRDAPDGRWTLSPPLPLPASGSEVRWQRTSSM